MAIVSKAIVRDSDGYVINVCLIEENMVWNNSGETLVLAGENCDLGDNYNKTTGVFTKAPVREATRLELLMASCSTTVKLDEVNGTQENGFMVPKTAEEIRVDKVALAELLKTEHATRDLSGNELNMRVRLNLEGY